MELAPGPVFPVKALCHKMVQAVFLIQTAFLHFNSGRLRHQIISILDPRIDRRVLDVAVSVSADPVELNEPIAESASRVDLTRADLVRLLIPCDDRLRPGTAGRGANLQDLPHCVRVGVQMDRFALRQDIRSKLGQPIYVQLFGQNVLRSESRLEFQGSHAVCACIAKALNLVEGGDLAALLCKPSVNTIQFYSPISINSNHRSITGSGELQSRRERIVIASLRRR